jgi:hypothetical protein
MPIQVGVGEPDTPGSVNPAYTLSITPNLHEALRRLRCTTTTQLLWADAICINQDDIDERNIQVNMMSEIYTKAASVAIWLGVGNPQDKDVMAIVAAAAKEYTYLMETYTTADERFERSGDRIPDPARATRVLMKFFGTAWCVFILLCPRRSA